MLRTHPSSRAYGPEELAVLQQTFDAVWKILYAHVPVRDQETTKHLGALLIQTLLTLAASGITDFDELKRRAVERMLLVRF